MTDKKPAKKYKDMKEEVERDFVMKFLVPKYKDGQSLREIAKAHGMNHEQVRLLLKKYGEYNG